MFGAQAMANFMISLEIMGLGMVGIFAVIVFLLRRLSGKSQAEKPAFSIWGSWKCFSCAQPVSARRKSERPCIRRSAR